MTVAASPSAEGGRLVPVSLDRYAALWSRHRSAWSGGGPFVTPAWLAAWLRCFGDGVEPLLLSLSVDDAPAGLVPLMVRDGEARFVGAADTCDHGDLLVAPEARATFARLLLPYLEQAGVRRVVLDPIRPDSHVLGALVPAAVARGHAVQLEPNGVSVEMPLPSRWEDYLARLDGKQRHEARRKRRRIAEAGEVEVYVCRDPAETGALMDTFLTFFRASRPDKDAYMTDRHAAFFRALAEGLARDDMLRLTRITIDGRPAAVVFCIDLGETTYLYNNGYDPDLRALSIGVISKLETIRGSIARGMAVYDFLNGSERYKYRMGGARVSLSTCTIAL